MSAPARCSPVAGHVALRLRAAVHARRRAAGRFIPLSALAGVLVVVCWNMAEKAEFARLLRDWRSSLVLLATFGLTLVEDLTTGIIAGCAVAAVLALVFRQKVAEEGDH